MIYECERSVSQESGACMDSAPNRKLYYHRSGSSSKSFGVKEEKSIFTLNIIGGLKKMKIRAICPGKSSTEKTKNQFLNP